MTNYVNINPGDGQPKKRFLVRVKSSRFSEHKYQDPNINSRVAITWTLESTRGAEWSQSWSTGLDWATHKDKVSPDGRKFAAEIKKNSDAFYALQKAINEAKFPSSRLTNDIGVFDGETFTVETDKNPRSPGSRDKMYPKEYHSEGWEAAKAAVAQRRADFEARQAGGTAPSTPVSSYAPPVLVKPDIKQAAGETLVAIVSGKGGRIKQNELLVELNKYIDTNKPTWATTPSVREDVTYALWTYAQITDIAQAFNLRVEGDASGFTVSK